MRKVLQAFLFLLTIAFILALQPVKTFAEDTIPATTDVLFHGPTDQTDHPKIALTFDADMTSSMKKALQSGRVHSWYNKAIIDELRATRTPATLFLTGMWAELYPRTTKELAKDPLFEIGNHSYSHPSFAGHCYGLTQIPQDQKEDQITRPQKIIADLTGVTPKYFRFPGGCYRSNDALLAQQLGLHVVQWDVVSGDAFSTNTAKITKNVLGKVRNGSIIVFHMHGGSNAPKTADALKIIIPELKKRGFEFVKVSEL